MVFLIYFGRKGYLADIHSATGTYTEIVIGIAHLRHGCGASQQGEKKGKSGFDIVIVFMGNYGGLTFCKPTLFGRGKDVATLWEWRKAVE